MTISLLHRSEDLQDATRPDILPQVLTHQKINLISRQFPQRSALGRNSMFHIPSRTAFFGSFPYEDFATVDVFATVFTFTSAISSIASCSPTRFTSSS